MAKVWISPHCNDIVAHLPGVKAEIKATAQAGQQRAKAILAAHRDTGHAKITLTRGTKLDWFVNLDDTASTKAEGGPAAHAIEFGRSGGKRGATQGVKAITGAF